MIIAKIAVDKKLKAVADQKIEQLKEAIEARQGVIAAASKAFNQTIDDLITGIDGRNAEKLVALQQELQNTFGGFASELIDQNDNCEKIAVDQKLKTVADQKIEQLKEAIKARQTAKNQQQVASYFQDDLIAKDIILSLDSNLFSTSITLHEISPHFPLTDISSNKFKIGTNVGIDSIIKNRRLKN